MKIYVLSRDGETDYTWRCSDSTGMVPPTLLEWHGKLSGDDLPFAVVAGYSLDGWSIEFRNLLLPGVLDNARGRRIVLNVCFSGLPDEAAVRALALEYLNFDLRLTSNGRIEGRYCPVLAAAYSTDANGTYCFDFDAAKAWAEKTIAFNRLTMEKQMPSNFTECHINPLNVGGRIEQVKRYLRQYALRQQNGIRLLWVSLYAPKNVTPDILMSFTQSSIETFASQQPVITTPEEQAVRRNAFFLLMSVPLALGVLIYLISSCGSEKKTTNEVGPLPKEVPMVSEPNVSGAPEPVIGEDVTSKEQQNPGAETPEEEAPEPVIGEDVASKEQQNPGAETPEEEAPEPVIGEDVASKEQQNPGAETPEEEAPSRSGTEPLNPAVSELQQASIQ